jgi:hypothetical protein
MKNTLLPSIIDDSLDHMFVMDKRGKMVFFPWGGKKQGYFLKSKSLMTRIKKFYTTSFFVSVVVFLIASSVFRNFWGIIGSMVVCFVGGYLTYYLYVSKIVKSLIVAKASYKEIILERLEPDDEKEPSQASIQIPTQRNPSTHQNTPDIFAQIEHIWYRLSPGQMFMACFFVSLFAGLFWSMYRPEQWVSADYLVGFLCCLLVGYGCFIVHQSIGPAKGDWFALQWKLSMIFIMIVGWSFAAWFLYKFMIVIIS